MSIKTIDEMRMLLAKLKTDDTFKDGDKVLLNVDRITGREQYARKLPAYKAFVEANRGTVFTVVRGNGVYGFQELKGKDGEIDWLFIGDDLLPAEGQNHE